MEIRQLRYFAAVVEEGTVTGAARRLNMTQPPLTAQIHALEAELGCPLFAREGRRLRLTEAGRALYRRAATILGLCDAAAGEMQDYRAGTAGTLRIGVVSSVRSTLFMGWLTRFAAQYPSVGCDIYGADTYQLLEQLRAGQLDIAIIRMPFSAPELEILYLQKERLLAAGQPRFFADAPGGEIALLQLAKKPLVLYRRWEPILRTRLEAVGCVPQVRCLCDDAQTTLALAEAGMGVGLAPASALVQSGGLAVRTVTDSGLDTQMAAVCRGRRQLPQAGRQFWAMLADMAAHLPDK